MKINSIGANYAGNYAQLGIAKRQSKSNITTPIIKTNNEGDTVSFKGANYPKRFRNIMGAGGTLASLGIAAFIDDIPFAMIGVPASVVVGLICFIAGDYLGIDLDQKIDSIAKQDFGQKEEEQLMEEFEDEDEEIKEHADN